MAENEVVTEKKVKEAKDKLLSMLESEGFINSVVETEIEKINEQSLKLTFNVNKGDEIIIKKANYHGSDNLDIIHPKKSGTIALTSDIPSSLKNPYALTISLNGTSQGPYDGSAAKNINITPGSIGAAVSNHSHDYLVVNSADDKSFNSAYHNF